MRETLATDSAETDAIGTQPLLQRGGKPGPKLIAGFLATNHPDLQGTCCFHLVLPGMRVPEQTRGPTACNRIMAKRQNAAVNPISPASLQGRISSCWTGFARDHPELT
ncbi:hypothetical protein GCM10019059_09580 [Camelimonas fluminis]|nr:hypothetical protein GCM10019059_09580 [Camelimonas fluminis]